MRQLVQHRLQRKKGGNPQSGKHGSRLTNIVNRAK
jgi:hypothetical protein